VGQKRRVATARALLLDPPFIIADEPTNDLDKENARTVISTLFARVHSGEAGLLFATHDKTLAKRADAVLELG
jgi:putative ABC transport system ATP-binding protein